MFILAPPCTFSWVVCAMVGGHPDACALPELHLFRAETVGEWLAMGGNESFGLDHGLVRAVAELWWGEQTAATVEEARGWLRRRAHLTTGRLFEEITERLAPRVAVEKSPSLAYGPAALRRTQEMFPLARYVHLVSHPRLYGGTVMDALARERTAAGRSLDPTHWLARLAAFPPSSVDGEPAADDLDPQRAWLALHGNIVEFLATVPAAQQTMVQGEDLVADDPAGLVAVAAWLGLRTDPVAVDAMRHPERSPFAEPGPPTAVSGSDAFVFGGCVCPPAWRRPQRLDGPVEWREDGTGLSPEVRALAGTFGYT